LIYLYVGLGMAMLLPIMVGLQTLVSVSELEVGEDAMQSTTGKIMTDWNLRLEQKTDAALSRPGYQPDQGYSIRSFSNGQHFCLVRTNVQGEKCPGEY